MEKKQQKKTVCLAESVKRMTKRVFPIFFVKLFLFLSRPSLTLRSISVSVTNCFVYKAMFSNDNNFLPMA